MGKVNESVLMVMGVLFVSLCVGDYPVPTPPHGRQAVHGWLIMPFDQHLPDWRDTGAPLEGWFSHHVPEFYPTSPHNFQIILRGQLMPLPHAGNVTVPIDIPYPPKNNLLGHEYTFTPPPPFSLNQLLNGDLTELQGVVYNGSFDTLYERIPVAIARFSILDLTRAVWLNDSSAMVPYQHLNYSSYPRSPTWNGNDEQHFYLAHNIHAAPDFDQIIHTSLNVSSCSMASGEVLSEEQWYEVLSPGATSWIFPSPNVLDNRLLPELVTDATAEVMWNGQTNEARCVMEVLEEIHCTVGPGFADRCPAY